MLNKVLRVGSLEAQAGEKCFVIKKLSADDRASEQIADWVFGKVICQAKYYVDLHGGDLIEALVPFTIFFRSATTASINHRSRWPRSLGCLVWFAARLPIPSFAPLPALAFPSFWRKPAVKDLDA